MDGGKARTLLRCLTIDVRDSIRMVMGFGPMEYLANWRIAGKRRTRLRNKVHRTDRSIREIPVFKCLQYGVHSSSRLFFQTVCATDRAPRVVSGLPEKRSVQSVCSPQRASACSMSALACYQQADWQEHSPPVYVLAILRSELLGRTADRLFSDFPGFFPHGA